MKFNESTNYSAKLLNGFFVHVSACIDLFLSKTIIFNWNVPKETACQHTSTNWMNSNDWSPVLKFHGIRTVRVEYWWMGFLHIRYLALATTNRMPHAYSSRVCNFVCLFILFCSSASALFRVICEFHGPRSFIGITILMQKNEHSRPVIHCVIVMIWTQIWAIVTKRIFACRMNISDIFHHSWVNKTARRVWI